MIRKTHNSRLTALFLIACVALISLIGCTPESPPLKPPTETPEAEKKFDPKDVVNEFYNALLVDRNFDKVYAYTRPPELLDQITESARSEFDDPSSDFDLYAYEKEEYEQLVPYIALQQPWFRILACEEIGAAATGEVNRIINGTKQPDDDDYESVGTRADYDEFADAGTDVYAAVTQWGFGEADEEYEETELIWVCCIGGKWYIIGDYW